MDVRTLHEQILSLREQVEKAGELAEPQRQATVENLAMVDEQLRRPLRSASLPSFKER